MGVSVEDTRVTSRGCQLSLQAVPRACALFAQVEPLIAVPIDALPLEGIHWDQSLAASPGRAPDSD